jgi:hypothetical protein
VGAGVRAAACDCLTETTASEARIGALVGAAAGAMYGLNEENKKSDAARAAYANCIARGGQ